MLKLCNVKHIMIANICARAESGVILPLPLRNDVLKAAGWEGEVKLICAATWLSFTSTLGLQQQMMALGRKGGGEPDELLLYLVRGMIWQQGGGEE